MSSPLGVGMIGAGLVTQAIHIPTLATLRPIPGRARDGPGRGGRQIRRCAHRARSTTDVQVLLDDPAVDVVAVCSPHRFHAEQVEAAAHDRVRYLDGHLRAAQQAIVAGSTRGAASSGPS